MVLCRFSFVQRVVEIYFHFTLLSSACSDIMTRYRKSLLDSCLHCVARDLRILFDRPVSSGPYQFGLNNDQRLQRLKDGLTDGLTVPSAVLGHANSETISLSGR